MICRSTDMSIHLAYPTSDNHIPSIFDITMVMIADTLISSYLRSPIFPILQLSDKPLLSISTFPIISHSFQPSISNLQYKTYDIMELVKLLKGVECNTGYAPYQSFPISQLFHLSHLKFPTSLPPIPLRYCHT